MGSPAAICVEAPPEARQLAPIPRQLFENCPDVRRVGTFGTPSALFRVLLEDFRLLGHLRLLPTPKLDDKYEFH